MAAVNMSSAAEGPVHRTNLKEIPPRATYKYTERFSKEKLDSLRLHGDPLADGVVSAMHAKYGLTNIHDLLGTVREKAQLAGAEGQVFRDFLSKIAEQPAWADKDMIERGQRVYAVHLPFNGLSLFSGSLVGGSQFITAAAVTALAGNITTNPTRWLDETGALLTSMALPGELYDAGKLSHDSLTRVRLLHAALRHWLPRSGRLDPLKRMVPGEIFVEGEVPINQQDLAITLSVFCYINLRSLRRMGIVLSSHDIKCYVMMWRYAGYVLGIDDELLPKSVEDQEEFMLCSMLHQGVPDRIKAQPIRDFVVPFGSLAEKRSFGLIPSSTVSSFLLQMVRYLNGEDVVKNMDIEDGGDNHWSVRLMRALGWSVGTVMPRYVPFAETAMFKVNTAYVRAQLRRRGTVTGHGAGTGQDIVRSQSKL